MTSMGFFPTAQKDELARHFLGKSIHDVPTPAAVLDVASARVNCERMLSACHSLNLAWRAHIKTHKVSLA